jgi:hypothetical protein
VRAHKAGFSLEILASSWVLLTPIALLFWTIHIWGTAWVALASVLWVGIVVLWLAMGDRLDIAWRSRPPRQGSGGHNESWFTVAEGLVFYEDRWVSRSDPSLTKRERDSMPVVHWQVLETNRFQAKRVYRKLRKDSGLMDTWEKSGRVRRVR